MAIEIQTSFLQCTCRFTVQLFINDTPCTIGTGNSIQNAERSAARQILEQIDEGSLSFSDISDQVCYVQVNDKL